MEELANLTRRTRTAQEVYVVDKVMAPHGRARAAPRQPGELPQIANILAPIVIFTVCLVTVWQVNRHDQLQKAVVDQERATGDHHFVLGGRNTHDNLGTKGSLSSLAEAGNSSDRRSTMQESTGQATSIHLSQAGHDSGQSSSSSSQSGAAAGTTGAGPASQQQGRSADSCHTQQHTELQGGVVTWGDKHLKGSAGECCQACKETDKCNVWVWCANKNGCGLSPDSHRSVGECWLKHADLDAVVEYELGKGHPGIPWTSGVLYSQEQWDGVQQRIQAKEEADRRRLAKLRADEDLPLVYLDVAIKGKPVGRMEFVLFTNTSPWAAENMRRMCTGEMGGRHHLKGATFYRIIDRFIDQTGVHTSGGALGGTFKDDAEGLKLKHDRKGLLSVANGGPNTNSGHFSILMGPAPHLNTHYVIFGECVSGWEVAEAVNALSQGAPHNELLNSPDAVITDVGQIRRGKPVPEDVVKAGLVTSR